MYLSPVHVAANRRPSFKTGVFFGHCCPRVVFRCNYKVTTFSPVQRLAVSEGQVANVKTLHPTFFEKIIMSHMPNFKAICFSPTCV